VTDAIASPLDILRGSFGTQDLDRLVITERIKSCFLTTDRFLRLEAAVKAASENLLLRPDDTKPFGPGNRSEGRIVLLVGETGAGKSSALHRLLDRHPVYRGYADPDKPNRAAISLKIKAPCTFVAMGRQTLAATGYPITGKLEKHAVWQRVFDRLPVLGTTVLHFDEMHNVILMANEPDRIDIQNTLKSLVTDANWPVTVIVSGLPLTTAFIEQAVEDKRRTIPVIFEPLVSPRDCEMLTTLARHLVAIAGLTLAARAQTSIVPRLIHAASYQLGSAINLLQQAIDQALLERTTALDIVQFASAYAVLSGCGPGANPFLTPNWRAVDCSRLFATNTDPRPAPETMCDSKAHRKRRR
jgi:hypothetical protein